VKKRKKKKTAHRSATANRESEEKNKVTHIKKE
jgi:hypothetical protein